MTIEVEAHTAADRRTRLYMQSESLTFVVDGSRHAGKEGNFRATRPSSFGSLGLRMETTSREAFNQKAHCKQQKNPRGAFHTSLVSFTMPSRVSLSICFTYSAGDRIISAWRPYRTFLAASLSGSAMDRPRLETG